MTPSSNFLPWATVLELLRNSVRGLEEVPRMSQSLTEPSLPPVIRWRPEPVKARVEAPWVWGSEVRWASSKVRWTLFEVKSIRWTEPES